MNTHERSAGMALGPFVGDALAMPVHWYYDRAAMRRDYGFVRDFVPPCNPHPDSILWRSGYTPLNEKGDILHEQGAFWGRHGIHYHQFLAAGENTLNLKLGRVLLDSLVSLGGYESEDYLQRYLDFMLEPGRHRDTYVEECHRNFFTRYARGKNPRKCAGRDVHIGGLAHVGLLVAFRKDAAEGAAEIVRAHVELTHRGPEVSEAATVLTHILCAVAEGANLREAIFEFASDWISRRKVEQWSKEPDETVIGRRLGAACYIEDAFPASLYLAWKYAGNFEEGVVANANLGGDNCHRGAVLGALLGAENGLEGIPSRYRAQLHQGEQLLVKIERMLTKAESGSPA